MEFRSRRLVRTTGGRSSAGWRDARFRLGRSSRLAALSRGACASSRAGASLVPIWATAFTRGCCTNSPRRARWSRSKAGVERVEASRSTVARPARPRRSQPHQRPSQRARPRFSQTALCNSHTRKPVPSLSPRSRGSSHPKAHCSLRRRSLVRACERGGCVAERPLARSRYEMWGRTRERPAEGSRRPVVRKAG